MATSRSPRERKGGCLRLCLREAAYCGFQLGRVEKDADQNDLFETCEPRNLNQRNIFQDIPSTLKTTLRTCVCDRPGGSTARESKDRGTVRQFEQSEVCGRAAVTIDILTE